MSHAGRIRGKTFPNRDDENFLHHSLCYFGVEGPRLDTKPVNLGHWEPEERKVLMSDVNKKFVISRFDPDQDEEPRSQQYEIPVQSDWKVLDAINFIKDEIDGSLSHRWSCRMAVCGSCGMMVNGEPKLTCKTALSNYEGTVHIEPLANFPIVRDLVVDIDGFMNKFESVKPWIVSAKEKAVEEGTHSQSPAELDAFKQFSMCINCMLCYSACPVVGE